MGYVGDGGAGLRRNHAMLRGSGHTFKKQRNYVSNGRKPVSVNESRMADIVRLSKSRELIRLVLVAIGVGIFLWMLWIIIG